MTPAQAAARVRKLRAGDVTVELWLTGFRVFFPSERREDTAEHDAYMLAPFIRAHGRRLLGAVTALMAQDWANKHPSQVRYLREAWEKAVAMRLVEFNVWSAVRLPRRRREQRPVPTLEQLDEVLARAKGIGGWYAGEFYDLVTVAAYTGARSGGLAQLDVERVDVVSRRMTVTEKGQKTRTIAVLAPARAAMARSVDRACARRDWPGPILVFRSPRGRPLNRKSIGEAWGAVRGDFSGPFHSLKHFAATWLAAQGVAEEDIAVQLGHTDSEGRPNTRLLRRVYNHPDSDEALVRIEQQLGEKVLAL